MQQPEGSARSSNHDEEIGKCASNDAKGEGVEGGEGVGANLEKWAQREDEPAEYLHGQDVRGGRLARHSDLPR